jgi:DNA repair protein SbcD/Mre11
MKLLHTSDWHIGRTFHGHSTIENLLTVLGALVDVVRDRAVDVVVVAGDVFDSSTPSADFITVLTDALRAIREAGAQVVMTSGNHDSIARLGYLSEFTGLAGIHIVTRPEQHDQPITIADEHGPVHFYGIPYLEPALVRHLYPDAALRTHQQVLDFVMQRIRADMAVRGGRSVVLSHCFAVGIAPGKAALGDVERDITSGGLDLVPLHVFDGPDYVALGHIHGRSQLSERVRYSGAPLHYSFSEAGKPRGGWLVELGADGLGVDGNSAEGKGVTWIDFPIPRPLRILTGSIDELLGDAAHADAETAWVCAILTDQVRPMDSMRRLQERFPWCVTLEHRPSIVAEASEATYAQRVHKKSDHEIVAGFLEHVRNGVGPSDFERSLLAEVITAANADSELTVSSASTGGEEAA